MNHRFCSTMQILLTSVVTIALCAYVEATAVIVYSATNTSVKWVTVPSGLDTAIDDTISITEVFPSVSAYSSRFDSGPVIQFKFTSNAVANYKDGDGTGDGSFDVIHGVSIANGYFTGTPTTKIIVASTDTNATGKQLCLGSETVTYDNTISSPDYDVKMQGICNTNDTGNSDIDAVDDFIFYIAVTPDEFYPQCSMTIKGAVAYNDEPADATTALTAYDYSASAVAATLVCGCTVKPDSLTHTGGKLTLDVVLTSQVEVPYTVFQLARDDSEKLLFDTSVTATADDYLTTWKAGKVAATFTTVSAAADPLTTSDSVTATLTTADKAADLNATLVSLDTDGTTAAKADVATDGTTEKPVKFEFTFVKDLCLGNKKVYVNCFLYGAAAANAAVDETVAANYKGKGTAQSFDCESGSDDSGAENSIGFSMFLLMLTALAIEL